MGFNYFGYGIIHKCGITDGTLYYYLPSGYKVTHTVPIVDIAEQCNPFISETVAFFLQDENNDYVGRFDTTYTVYRRSDGLMIGSGNWDAPVFPHVVNCGYIRGDGRRSVQSVYIDVRDKRSIYIPSRHKEGVMLSESNMKFDMEFALISVNNYIVPEDCHIYDERGDLIATDKWTVQDMLRSEACTMFL